MGILGWSYPPGCNGTPFDEDHPCEVCGEFEDDCICPECPVCGDVGNPDCYRGHGLKRSEAQKFSIEVQERGWRQDFEAYKAVESLFNDSLVEDHG